MNGQFKDEIKTVVAASENIILVPGETTTKSFGKSIR